MKVKEKIKNITPKPFWDFARRTQLSLKNFFELFEDEEKTLMYAGVTLHYNRGNSVVARLKNEKIYEEEMCVHLINTLKVKEKPVLMDIGANIGLVTTYLLKEVPNLHIYAFEPGPKQAELLRKTISTNALEGKITLTQIALSETAGTQTFYVHPKRDQAKDGLKDTERGEKTLQIEVETSTLDAWWEKAEKPHVDVVKIDTEGAELFVLRGATQFLKEVKPILYLEIEPSNLKAYPYTHVEIVKYLFNNQYRLETLSGTVVTLENMESVLENEDTFVASSK